MRNTMTTDHLPPADPLLHRALAKRTELLNQLAAAYMLHRADLPPDRIELVEERTDGGGYVWRFQPVESVRPHPNFKDKDVTAHLMLWALAVASGGELTIRADDMLRAYEDSPVADLHFHESHSGDFTIRAVKRAEVKS